MSGPASVACRRFDERLLERLETDPRWSLDPPSPDALFLEATAGEPHLADCRECTALVDVLRGNAVLVRGLVPPVLSEERLELLRAVPSDLWERSETRAVLALLEPGRLASPEPSPELRSRLAFLPAREAARRRERAAVAPGWSWRRLLDWRLGVAGAYVATMIFVTILHVDPMSVARGTAGDLSRVGERAVGEARRVAAARLAPMSPFSKRFDYRVYRTVAAGRARAVAYSQLVFEKVFGGAFERTADAGPRKPDREPEPKGRDVRS